VGLNAIFRPWGQRSPWRSISSYPPHHAHQVRPAAALVVNFAANLLSLRRGRRRLSGGHVAVFVSTFAAAVGMGVTGRLWTRSGQLGG
jgi:hypothetical protein